MLIISFLDPRNNLKQTTIGLHNLPKEDQFYDHLQELLKKAKGDMITVEAGLPDGQMLRLPNVYFTALTEPKDEMKLIIPPPPN